MKSIIKEIFYGERGHFEKVKASAEYLKILGEIADKYEVVKKDLPEEKKKEFEEFCDLRDSIEVKTADDHFIEGVKIGILLGIEACN